MGIWISLFDIRRFEVGVSWGVGNLVVLGLLGSALPCRVNKSIASQGGVAALDFAEASSEPTSRRGWGCCDEVLGGAKLGWMMGVEPTTTGTTIRGSAN
jgi:hypothetical protein